MKFFVVTYVHPDVEGCKKYVSAHIEYLQNLIKEGTLRAAGPFIGIPQSSAMLILYVASREEALNLISNDPYMIQGLVPKSTVTEWDPVFGVFQK